MPCLPIVSMDMPFKKMNELADLVFKASEIKEKIIEESSKAPFTD